MSPTQKSDIDKKRIAELERQKRIEMDKKKSIDAQIKKTKKKIRKAARGAEKATANIQKFQKRAAEANQRRDVGKAAKFRKVTERRTQNLVRARTARERLVAELRQLEKGKANPSSPQSPIQLGAPLPKMRKIAPTPLPRSPISSLQKMTPKSPQKIIQKSPQIDQRKQQEQRKQQDLKKQHDLKQQEQKKQFDKKQFERKQADLKKQQEQRKQIDQQKQQVQRKQQDQRKKQDQQRQIEEQKRKMMKQQKRSFGPKTPSPVRRRR
jgi:hypothetical protein